MDVRLEFFDGCIRWCVEFFDGCIRWYVMILGCSFRLFVSSWNGWINSSLNESCVVVKCDFSCYYQVSLVGPTYCTLYIYLRKKIDSSRCHVPAKKYRVTYNETNENRTRYSTSERGLIQRFNTIPYMQNALFVNYQC